MRTKKKFIRKKGKFFDLHASLNESELQKVKSVQTELVFFMILVKFFHSKEFHGEMSVKLYKYQSAVRGYHYYRNYWQPVVGEELGCMHERDNPFDLFAMAKKKTTGETVGYLPQKNSRVTKHLMDRRARFTVVLTSSQYCVSPLVQGGLEISSEVGIYLPPTQKLTSLSESTITLSNRKLFPVLKAL